jgi:rare lipoprotein A
VVWNLGVKRVATASLLAGIALGAMGCQDHSPRAAALMVCSIPHDEVLPGTVTPGHADLSGGTRLGKASFYAGSFANRLMANGRRMNPQGANAASRTLPLGSTAKVINVETGQSAIVSIEDRGPYVKGRILDLSPATARKIGISRRIGVAEVKVAPIALKLPDGSMKPGSGAPQEPICRATTS